MNVQRPPSELAESLLKITDSGDEERLREFLQGRHLPAVGGDLSPADIIYRACEEVADRLDWDSFARILAAVITTQANEAAVPRGSEQVYVLRNAFDLAVEFAPNPTLGSALIHLLFYETDELFLPFLRALVFHQEDGLEDYWLAIIAAYKWQGWTPGTRTILLTAWRGLLWIPTVDDRSVIDFDRIDRGLEALSLSVEERPKAGTLLLSALGILQETYPRSVEFWEEHLGPFVDHWSPTLREVAYRQWPGLRAPIRRRLAG
jgi:hypothetical protein